MRETISLFKLLAIQSFAQMLAYRLSATFIIVFGTLFAVAEVVSLLVFYQFTDNIAGWDFYSFLALIATFSLIQYLYQFFFVLSHEELMDKIINGQLDYDLIRPIDSQLLCNIKNLDYPSLINMIIPIGLLIYCWPHFAASMTILRLILYIMLILCGVLFYYLINQFFVSMSFWIERPQKLIGIPEYLFEFASRPRKVYPIFMQFILSIILPVITVTNLPVEILIGEFNLIYLLSLFVSILILSLIVRWQWLAGVRKYSSTN